MRTTQNVKQNVEARRGLGTSKLCYATFLLSILLTVSELANAQSWLWAKGMGGIDYDNAFSIAIDPATGAVYSTGNFWGTVDFDPGSDTFNLTGYGGTFISKLDASGNFVWAKSLEGTYLGVVGVSIVVDPGSGDVYTTGYFGGTVDFDPGAGIFNLTAPEYYVEQGCYSKGCDCWSDCSYYLYTTAMFISKLDISGNFVWAKAMVAPNAYTYEYTYSAYASSIALDISGNGDVYTTGSFSGTVDFDPGGGIFNLSGYGMFISKLDASGNFVWAKAMQGSSGSSIVIDSAGGGDVYTTGSFYGTVDFDPGSATFNLTAPGGNDIFVSKLDAAGNFVWAKAMEGIGYYSDFGSSIALDPGNGDVYTTGLFLGIVDFDPGSGTFNLTTPEYYFYQECYDPDCFCYYDCSYTGYADAMFISKLDSSGNFKWAKAMSGANSRVSGRSIGIDPAGSGDVYTTGSFSGTIDFDPDSTISFSLTSAGGLDIFISKLDSAGNFVGTLAEGGTSLDNGHSIALDASGNVHLAGSFSSSSISFGSTTLTSAGGSDIFITQLDGIGPPCTSIVTNTSDNDSGSLRNIVSCSSSGDTITFSLAPMSQITLTTGEIVINKNLIISGLGMLDLTISGNNASRIFHLFPGKNLELENLSLKNATAVTQGGAIFAKGNLTLENVLLQNNFENAIPKGMTLISPGELTIVGNVEIKN